MIISAIVAFGNNREIGKDNQIPWYLPNDLKWFKKTTINHHVLMGRKNFEAMGKPLPKRTNIVLTRNPFFLATGCLVVHSLEEGLELAESHGVDELFIIGGEQIYRAFIPYYDKLYLTEIDIDIPGADTFFPEIDLADYTQKSHKKFDPDDKNKFHHAISIYERKS